LGKKYKNRGFGEEIRRGETIFSFSFSPAVLYLLPHNHRIFSGKILWLWESR